MIGYEKWIFRGFIGMLLWFAFFWMMLPAFAIFDLDRVPLVAMIAISALPVTALYQLCIGIIYVYREYLAPHPMNLLLLCVLFVVSGCAVGNEWSIPECKADGRTPCVGRCEVKVDTQTVADVPLAVRVRTAEGKLACEEIREL